MHTHIASNILVLNIFHLIRALNAIWCKTRDGNLTMPYFSKRKYQKWNVWKHSPSHFIHHFYPSVPCILRAYTLREGVNPVEKWNELREEETRRIEYILNSTMNYNSVAQQICKQRRAHKHTAPHSTSTCKQTFIHQELPSLHYAR